MDKEKLNLSLNSLKMKITNIPFYYNSHNKSDNGGQPHVLPFKLTFDNELKMFRQVSNPELNKILVDVYDEGSMIEGSVSTESGRGYLSKVINYIKINFPLNSKTKILEIGFGSGNILRELKKNGINNLIGIEPGKNKLLPGLENIKLIRDYYPSSLFRENVNLILHFGVLEHIENVDSFLIAQKNQLKKDGKIIFFVPNEEPYIHKGDISTFVHEHFNYFTKSSIYKLIKKVGLFIEDISIIDGMLAITASKNHKISYQQRFELIDSNIFFNKFKILLKNLKILLKQYGQNEIVLYAPARALNIMFLLNMQNFRLVNDSNETHNKYLPFFSNKIESFDMILKNPPKAILIFSRTFGQQIKNKCLSHNELGRTKMFLIEEI